MVRGDSALRTRPSVRERREGRWDREGLIGHKILAKLPDENKERRKRRRRTPVPKLQSRIRVGRIIHSARGQRLWRGGFIIDDALEMSR
jgi:hypothetical protein